MTRTATVIALLLGFISSTGYTQNMTGLWLGVTYPSSPDQEIFNYTMTLDQKGTTLSGTAQTANPSVPFGGSASISGQVAGTSVTFNEADQTGNTAVKGLCFWKGKLTYNPTDESLTGTYESITNGTTCTISAGGTVELYRIVLKSGTSYCKGSAINLTVTGKNIRWYSSENKTTLLATGNTFSPQLSQKTTFYITQTLYKNESPAIPITIDVTSPTISDLKTVSPRCGTSTGEVSLTATGGSGPLTYSLDGTTFQRDPIFRNLPGGNYSVRVRDETGCEVTRAVSLPASFSVGIASVKATAATCGKPGSLTVTTTGGSGAIESSTDGQRFQMGTVIAGLQGGAYTVRIRDGAGCGAAAAVNIAGSSGPVMDSVQTTAPKCLTANGALTALATGGEGALTYSIDGVLYQQSPQFTNLIGGKYTIRVRDASGCEVSKTETLPPSNPLLIVSTTIVPTTCGLTNGEASLTVSGGSGPVLFSTDGRRAQTKSTFDSLKAGTYTLFAQDSSGCTAGQSITIDSSTIPTITDIQITPEGCSQKNASVTVISANPASQYTFSIDGKNFQSDNVFTGLSSGAYTVSMADQNECLTTRAVNLVSDCANAVYIPSAFSPNADSRNDALTSFFSVTSLNVVRFVVYDRWGSVIYSRADFTLTNGEAIWNGEMSGGNTAPAGIYPCTLHCRFPDGTQTTYRQSVAVLK